MKKKHLLLSLALCLMMPLSALAQLSDGDYFLMNVGAGKGLNFADDQGYRAVFADHPHVLAIKASGSTYTIGGHHTKSYNINASGSYASSGAAFTITEVGTDTYTLSVDGGSTFVGYDGSDVKVAMNLTDGTSDNAKWVIKTREQLLADLAAATETNPIDATFLLYAVGFNRHDGDMATHWLGSFSSSHTGYCTDMARNQCCFFFNDGTNWSNGAFDVYQQVTDAPTGKYLLKCQGYYRYGSNTVGKGDYNYETGTSTPGSVLYAGEESTPLMTYYSLRITDNTLFASQSSSYLTNITYGGTKYYFPYISAGQTSNYQSTNICSAFDAGGYSGNELEFTFLGGTLQLGVKTSTNVQYEWTAFDNFELIYLGPLQDLTPYKDLYYALRTTIQDHIISQTSVYTDDGGAAASAYNAVLATQDDIVENATSEEEITAAKTVLWNAALTFMKSVEINDGMGFDLTWMIGDPDFSDQNYKNYWTEECNSTNTHGYTSGVLRYYNSPFNVYQQLPYILPAGAYRMKVDGFERTNDPMNTAWEDYQMGTSVVTGTIYLNDNELLITNLFDMQSVTDNSLGGKQPSDAWFYIPDGSSAANNYLANGYYPNTLICELDDDALVTIGYRCANTKAWTAVDNFQLEYIGDMPEVAINVTADELVAVVAPFTLNVNDDDIDELYGIASEKDNQILLYPVNTVKAGTPCVAKFNTDSYSAPMEMMLTNGKMFVMPWEGGYMSVDAANYTWNYFFQSGDGSTTGQSLEKVVLDFSDPNNFSFNVNLENLAARRYLEKVYYSGASDDSSVADFNVAPPARRDIPNPVMLPVPPFDADEVEVQVEDNNTNQIIATMTIARGETEAYVYNLLPRHNYKYYVDGNPVGTFETIGRLRMIYAPSAYNIRDLGGWETQDRRRTTYGHLYRGSTLNGYVNCTPEDIQALKDLGIGGEIDLRYRADYDKDMGCGTSAFGFGADDYFFAAANDYLASDLNNSGTQGRLKAEFDFILRHFRQGKAVYFHCAWGADRTGLLAFLLEGLLGLTIDQIYKDYELTSFSAAPGATNRLKTSFQDRIDVILALDGATLRDKFENYFLNKMGVPMADITYFRSVMLDIYPLKVDEDAALTGYNVGRADITFHRTLKEGKHNTVVLPCDLTLWESQYFFGEGTKIENIVSYEDGVLKTEEITNDDDIAPANKPFLLIPASVNDNNTYTLQDVPICEGELTAAEFTNGKMVGTYTAIEVAKSTETGKENYVISNDQFYVIGSSAAPMKSTRAYLVLDTPSSGVKSIVTFDNGEATGIQLVESGELRDECEIYDLAGRKLSTLNTQHSTLPKGVYIVNGKKVWVK